jgi:hypothetical protein
VSPYVIGDASIFENSRPQPSTAVAVIVYDDDVLPVFSSRDFAQDFIKTHHSAEEPTSPMPFEIDPIKLAVMVGGPQHRRLSMVFDPVAASAGRWTSAKKPMSVSAYRRYILELARGVKKLFAEGRKNLEGSGLNPEKREELLAVWGILQAEKVATDARARVGEWQIEDGSWIREEPSSPTH